MSSVPKISAIEALNAADQLSTWLQKVARLPELTQFVASGIQAEGERLRRVEALEQQETNTRARLEAFNAAVNQAEMKAEAAYRKAIADQRAELAAIQSEVGKLSEAAAGLRTEVQELTAKKTELAERLSGIAKRLA